MVYRVGKKLCLKKYKSQAAAISTRHRTDIAPAVHSATVSVLADNMAPSAITSSIIFLSTYTTAGSGELRSVGGALLVVVLDGASVRVNRDLTVLGPVLRPASSQRPVPLRSPVLQPVSAFCRSNVQLV